MTNPIQLTEKYERNGWPSLARPDLKPPDGWSLPLITGVNRVRNHNPSPAGDQLAFIWDRDDQSDIYILDAAGGWPRRLTTDRRATRYYADAAPQWSPDGRWLAFEMNDHVYLLDALGGVPRQISDFGNGAFTPMWLPNSNDLLISTERDNRVQLLLTDRQGSWPRGLVTGAGDVWDPQPSPDGKRVLYVRRPFDDLNRLDICMVELESGQVHEVARSQKQINTQPRWAPNGQHIAFLSQRSGYFEIWLINGDGSGLRQLTNVGYDFAEIVWAPDGSQLAATLNRGGAFDLVLVDAGNGAVTYLRSGTGLHMRPHWSPDGASLTFEYESPQLPPDLYRMDLIKGQVTQLTFSNLPALARHDLITPQPVSYRSFDELEIPALLYRPAHPNGAAVVYVHGGPSSQYVYDWHIFIQYLLAKGYTVLAPNYRGSTGYGVEFEHANYGDWGGGDMQDCLHAARYLHTLEWVDRERIAIYGPSYGGYMTVCSLARDPDHLFACGVDVFGDANLVSSWAQCNRDLRLYSEIFLGHPAENWQTYRQGSPLYQVENIQKPMLILHGLEDTVVPPQASEELVEALKRHDKLFEYKTYAGEPHGFLRRANALDAFTRIERFLDWHLLPRKGSRE